jgi:Cys-rich protein (TIGR01571 family)
VSDHIAPHDNDAPPPYQPYDAPNLAVQLNAHTQRAEVCATGVQVSVPSSGAARVMYYLACMRRCTPQFRDWKDLEMFLDWHSFMRRSDEEKTKLYWLAHLFFRPDLLAGRFLFIVPAGHPLLCGMHNQFYRNLTPRSPCVSALISLCGGGMCAGVDSREQWQSVFNIPASAVEGAAQNAGPAVAAAWSAGNAAMGVSRDAAGNLTYVQIQERRIELSHIMLCTPEWLYVFYYDAMSKESWRFDHNPLTANHTQQRKPRTEDFHTPLFDCLSEPLNCVITFLCPCYAYSMLRLEVDDSANFMVSCCCTCGCAVCFGWFVSNLRDTFREKYRLKAIDECFTNWCCSPCAIAQMQRELNTYKRTAAMMPGRQQMR